MRRLTSLWSSRLDVAEMRHGDDTVVKQLC
jgi:hypothetical protein